MVNRTDSEWLDALQQTGEIQKEALTDLRDYLFRAAFVYLRDGRQDMANKPLLELWELAEDAAQEATLSIRANLDNFRGDSKFTTWAYRFVINEVAGELRRRRSRHLSLDSLRDDELAVMMKTAVASPQFDPELAAAREEVIQLILQIIEESLNEKQQLAMKGVYFQGYSIQEVAHLLDTSANTLYKILHDARKRIKQRLLAQHLSKGDLLALFNESL